MARWTPAAIAAVLVVAQPVGATAQDGDEPLCSAGASSCAIGDRVLYLPAFFSQYNPITALDMVQRVPGFSIDIGDEVRGFGAAGGNVLIDGQRPSTKSADLEDVLSRIAAGNVARIELIRGGTGGLDVGGQSVVVNVVLAASATGREPAPWEFSLLKRRPDGGVRPRGEVSFLGRLGKTKYRIGANVFATSLRSRGEEQITRFFGEDETRSRAGAFRDQGGGVNLGLERAFANGDVARLNFEGAFVKFRDGFTETRLPAAGGTNFAFFDFEEEEFEFEIGGDYERQLADAFGVKLIALINREFEEFEDEFELAPETGQSTRSIFAVDETVGETIGRLEFDWTGWRRHTIQFGGEIAHNFIDSEASLSVEDSTGALQPVAINGANTRVTELRGEPFVKDSWSVRPDLTIDLGFALELSQIEQSGDSDNSRFFVYPKPSVTLTYNLNPQTQWRISAEREVNQLSFGEFVSSVNFDDEDVDFGNPELQPQRTWSFEMAFERRFGEIGVIELIGFYDRVQDVEDLLPIGGVVEVPGNIGDGKLWGGTASVTAPLDFIGLKNARLESEVTVRDSSVRDPVTGLDRDFSFTPDRIYEISYRQDFQRAKISWGWSIGNEHDEFGFGLDEFSVFSRDEELDAFIETTVIEGVKIQLEANDILNVTNTRDRTVFQGSRALGVPLFREVRGLQNGGGVTLTLSGAF